MLSNWVIQTDIVNKLQEQTEKLVLLYWLKFVFVHFFRGRDTDAVWASKLGSLPYITSNSVQSQNRFASQAQSAIQWHPIVASELITQWF